MTGRKIRTREQDRLFTILRGQTGRFKVGANSNRLI